MEYPEYFADEAMICVTANRFDSQKKYDAVLCVGELNNKRFDPLQCMSARNIDVLLYECEEKVFTFRRKKIAKYERKLNQRIGATRMEDDPKEDDSSLEMHMDKEMKRFSVLDEYIDALNTFDIHKLVQRSNAGGINAPMSEVKYLGTFVSG